MRGSHWIVLTGEYPPQPGGVSDYSRLVARHLVASGDRVTVCAPPVREPELDDDGVTVVRLRDRFGPGALSEIGRLVDASAGARILVQYVPHAFGWKAMNLPFCLWLRSRRDRGIWVMFHEVAFPISRGQPWDHNALGLVTRGMAGLVGSAATRAFVSTSAWEPLVSAVVREGTPVIGLPIPSVIDPVADQNGVGVVRNRFPTETGLVGHVGTCGDLIQPLLTAALKALLMSSRCHLLLVGRGTDRFADRLAADNPDVRGRVHGTGELTASDLSRHVSACDVLLQPYPDGVTTRRTTAMVGLAHGRPVVTTAGALTERQWHDVPGVILVPVEDTVALGRAAANLADHVGPATKLGAAARSYYDEHFDVRHTVAALRDAASQDLRRLAS